MPALVPGLLAFFSLLAGLIFYQAVSDIAENLSPQGCRMSWMSPSYVKQANFNGTWSDLSHRYSLWLYREVEWDSLQDTYRVDTLPVLFIPGNAGSSHQVRSIASSATRQYFSSPHIVSQDFQSRSVKPLDFFAVEFNEDLSAFHGSTLESQIRYSSQAISYILSLYPPGTKILVVGHSMGGVVATSLLPSDNISAVVTMSTPHTLPPARFDYRIDKLYRKLENILQDDPTPIVSICGGATDLMIPSESCILPKTGNDVFRRTIFTSALEGAWTGVGHREMVWCHQVRWRVARSALELGAAETMSSRATVLDKWLRDGHILPPNIKQPAIFDPTTVEKVAVGEILTLRQPHDSKAYLLSVPPLDTTEPTQKIVVLASRATISGIAPETAGHTHVSVFLCVKESPLECFPLKPDTLKLLPNPVPGKPFPIPQEGSDESEGVVLYEALIPRKDTHQWIGIKVDGADEHAWVISGITQAKPILSPVSTLRLAMSPQVIKIPADFRVTTSFTFPNLISNALIVYRVTTQNLDATIRACSSTPFPPLLMHTSHSSETHYYPLTGVHSGRTLIHSHLGAPFIDHNLHSNSYVNLTVIASADSNCRREFTEVVLAIDWSATLARWASRYLHALVSWAAGVSALIVYIAWLQQDTTGSVPTVGQSLNIYGTKTLKHLILASLILSLIPFREWAFTGTRGLVFLAPIAPLILLVASGLVYIVYWILSILLTVVGRINEVVFGSRTERSGVPSGTVLSLFIICLSIFLFVPWQVAYVGCWFLHFHTCASSAQQLASLHRNANSGEEVPLVTRTSGVEEDPVNVSLSHERRPTEITKIKQDNYNNNMHILLLMTWLLPLTAPVLAVWVRTLLTAGYTTPFDGDHNFLAVLPFLIFADFASWTPERLFAVTKLEKRLPPRWIFALVAGTAFIFGSRKPYLVLDVARVAMWAVVIGRIGRRYWGGQPWAS